MLEQGLRKASQLAYSTLAWFDLESNGFLKKKIETIHVPALVYKFWNIENTQI